MSRCPRCGDPFERYEAGQRYCRPCERDVLRRVLADEQRRSIRRVPARDETGWIRTSPSSSPTAGRWLPLPPAGR
jgi:uncharacterized Zn finger protein (UPF0148 family)